MKHQIVPFSCLVVLLLVGSVSGDDRVQFNRDIRPILSDKCYACHGPHEEKREAGLRLDKKEGALAELDSGDHAIVQAKWK